MGLDRPILITGTPRSGKSCISHILNHSDEFKRISEPILIWDMGIGNRQDDTRAASEATPALRAQIVHACEELLGDDPPCRYLDDLAYHALRIPFVHKLMPEAKIVHVIRGARDSVPEMAYGWSYKDSVMGAISRRRHGVQLRTLPRHLLRFIRNQISQRVKKRRATWGPRVPGLSAFSAAHSVAEVAAYQWMKMVEIAVTDLEAIPRENWLEVRFDRLLADPGGEALRIARFCEAESPQAIADFSLDYINPEHVFDKRVEPTTEQWDRINQMIRPLQERLGLVE